MATLRGRRHALSEDLQESALSLTISPVSGRTRPDSAAVPSLYLDNSPMSLYRPFPGMYEVNGVPIWIVNPEFSVAIFWPGLHLA